MKKETLVALRKSIRKWKGLETTSRVPAEERVLTDTCALCKMFHHQENDAVDFYNSCRECPVYQKTGHRFCVKTPHDAAYAMREAAASAKQKYGADSFQTRDAIVAFNSAAMGMRCFLESLLPTKTK